MVQNIILFPFGGNAREALMTIEQINKFEKTWKVLGFIDDDRAKWGKVYRGVKVLGGRDVLQKNKSAKVLAVAGNPNNYLKRGKIIDSLNVAGSRFATIIHPGSVIGGDVKVGVNCLIMANTVLTSLVTVGDHCIILPNTTISHDTVIGNYCCIGANVAVAGYVTIGENCYIGSGANIRDHITIGKQALVGLGSNVVKDVKTKTAVAGNPAKAIKRSAI